MPRKQRNETADMRFRINQPKSGLRAVPAGKQSGTKTAQAASKDPAMGRRNPPLAGVLVKVRQAFQGLCVQASLQVISALMREARTARRGPKGVPDDSRRAVRGGKTAPSIVLGGQRGAPKPAGARLTTVRAQAADVCLGK